MLKMVNIQPNVNTYTNQYFEVDYEDKGFRERYGPCIPDDVFEKFMQYDSPKSGELDKIENVTLQIFLHLYSCADRIKRAAVEDAIPPPAEEDMNSLFGNEFFEDKSENVHRFRPFRKETNFAPEEEQVEHVMRTQHVVSNIFFTLLKFLFGYEHLNPNQDRRTNEEMIEDLKNDKRAWDKLLDSHYDMNFNIKMKHVFAQTNELLMARKNIAKYSYYQRITFFASCIVTFVGMLISQKAVIFFGLLSSVITLFIMIKHYGQSSFRIVKLETDLKYLIEQTMTETRLNRLRQPPVPPFLIEQTITEARTNHHPQQPAPTLLKA
jgi:hypothetical protein